MLENGEFLETERDMTVCVKLRKAKKKFENTLENIAHR